MYYQVDLTDNYNSENQVKWINGTSCIVIIIDK